MLRGHCKKWRCQACFHFRSHSRLLSVCVEGTATWKNITQQCLEVYETFSCSWTNNSLAPQQSDRAEHVLGLHVGLPVYGGDMDFSSKPLMSERTPIHTCTHANIVAVLWMSKNPRKRAERTIQMKERQKKNNGNTDKREVLLNVMLSDVSQLSLGLNSLL